MVSSFRVPPAKQVRQHLVVFGLGFFLGLGLLLNPLLEVKQIPLWCRLAHRYRGGRTSRECQPTNRQFKRVLDWDTGSRAISSRGVLHLLAVRLAQTEFQDPGLSIGLSVKSGTYIVGQNQVEHGDTDLATVEQIAIADPAAKFIIRRFAVLGTFQQIAHPRKDGLEKVRDPVRELRALTLIDPGSPAALAGDGWPWWYQRIQMVFEQRDLRAASEHT